MALIASVFASPLTRQEVDTAIRGNSNGGSIINAPLTNWIKNENTDLQWYTTISVGTPPQQLYVLHDHHLDPPLILPNKHRR